MEIKDSGERTQFYDKDGNPMAVRDCHDGKGRCDLLPLDTVAEFLSGHWENFGMVIDPLMAIDMFLFTRDTSYALLAIYFFCKKREWDEITAILEVSKHFEDGAKKYSPRNWEKGIPLSRYVDSGVRHYLKWLRGDEDEPHDRAFVWNMLCLVWTMNNHPECNDLTPE